MSKEDNKDDGYFKIGEFNPTPIEKQLDEVFNMAIDASIEAVKSMRIDAVNDDTSAFYWGIDRDETIEKIKSLKK